MEHFRPCITYNYRIARARFRAGIDVEEAFRILSALGEFDSVKLSLRLGLVKTVGQETILLLSNGEISLRPVMDPEAAYHRIKELGYSLWPAQVCGKCKKNYRDCATSSCGESLRAARGGSIPLEDEESDEK